MNVASIFLLLSGWAIVLSSIVLFSGAALRECFVLAGMCLQAFGLVLAFFGAHGQSSRRRMLE